MTGSAKGAYRKKFLAAALFFAACASGFTLDAAAYRRDFEKNWKEAEAAAREIRPLLLEALGGDRRLTDVGMAVVFPEFSRYSYIRDVAETSALELFYIMNGKGNFSIGRFQMKPSFAVSLESDAGAESRRLYPELFRTGATDRETRILRIERLCSLRGQVEYFAVFLRLMDSRWPGLREDPERMVKLFSAAYNAGYDKSAERLLALAEICYFPYGFLGIREQYSYSGIALMYYRENGSSD